MLLKSEKQICEKVENNDSRKIKSIFLKCMIKIKKKRFLKL